MACDNSKCAFRFVVLLIGVGILALACYILGTKVIPPIHDYNTEKSDHQESICTFRYTNITGTKTCSYPIRCPDDDEEGPCMQERSFPCIQIYVSYQTLNSNVAVNAELYRSYKDARETDFECSAHECEHSGRISAFKNDTENVGSFNCHYNPNKQQYVYKDATKNSDIVPNVIFLVLGLIYIVLTVAAVICICRRT